MGFFRRKGTEFVGFLRTVGRSCYDLSFYREVRHRPARRAFAYLALFGALYCAVLFVPAVPKAIGAVGELRALIVGQVPDGTAFSMKNGQFSMMPEDPIAFGGGPVVVLDPVFDGVPMEGHAYRDTDLVVGRSAAFVPKARGGWERASFDGIPDFEVTKDSVLAEIDRRGIAAAVGLMAVVAIVFYAVFLISRAANAALFAALALLLGSFSGVRIRYRGWWATCLHAATVPTLAEYVFGAFGVSVSYVLPVITLLFVVAVIADERANPSGTADVAPAAPRSEPEGKPRKRSGR